jgi:Zn-dependent protease with chaperone function
MLVFVPSTDIQNKTLNAVSVSVVTGSFPFGRFLFPPAQPGYMLTVLTSTVLSVTGIICIVGLVAGTLFALSMVLADDRVARKVLHVILLSPNEYQWLQAKIADSSEKLSIAAPKIGVVEDLRPNAFTIGYGRNSTIVFSMGLFNILSKEEMIAVACHELAHVRNNDFFFKTLSNALTIVSFFNPLSYVASSTAQREREMFADERAIGLLEKPSALGDALAKICRAIQNLPKEGVLFNFSSNLLVASSVLHRVGILSTHPRLDTRLRNICAPRSRSRRWSHRNTQLAFLLSLLLVASAVAVS